MILVFVTDRANYGRLKPLLRLMEAKGVEHQICWSGAVTADGWGQSYLIGEHGGPDGIQVLTQIASDSPRGECKSIALCVDEFSRVISDTCPEFAIVIGDRYQALAAATACTYHHVNLIHIQGGEKSGTVDNAARNAITKLADWHIPATKAAHQRLLDMGENPERVITTGCPSTDLMATVERGIAGVGPLVVMYHPCREDPPGTFTDIIRAVDRVAHSNHFVFWPNIDQGHAAIDDQIRRLVPKEHRIKTLAPEAYYQLLANARCLIGNSSSFVRDSAWFGTPVVLVGGRQIHRQYAANVAPFDGHQNLEELIRIQLNCPRPKKRDTTYGDGKVCERIVKWLKNPKRVGVKL